MADKSRSEQIKPSTYFDEEVIRSCKNQIREQRVEVEDGD
ncbi:hypothetical protein LINPERHAP1_LOCUS41890 [Linum perenne]